MGCWDIACVICGAPPTSSMMGGRDDYTGEILPELKKYIKVIKWMNTCTILTADGDSIHGLNETDCNVAFSSPKTKMHYETVKYSVPDKYNRYGIFLHTDCCKYVEKQIGSKLTMGHFPDHMIDSYMNYVKGISYGGIENYFQQDFNIIQLNLDKKDFMVYSPMGTGPTNKKNQQRINKVITQLKLKGKSDRKGPPVSASFYKNNIYKIGMDKQIWVTSKGKWVPYKCGVIIKSIQSLNKDRNKINLMRMLKGVETMQSSSNPLFHRFIIKKGVEQYIIYGDKKLVDKF